MDMDVLLVGATSWLNWTEAPAPAPGLFAARTKFRGVALADGSMLFMGGTDCLSEHDPLGSCHVFNDVHELRAGDNVLNEITPAAEWEPGFGFCLTARAGSDDVFMIGGATNYGWVGGPSKRLYNDAWKSVDRGAKWAKISTTVFDAFGAYGIVFHDCASTSPTTLVVVGGAAGFRYSTVRKSVDSGKTWATVGPSPSCASQPAPWIGTLGNGRIQFGFAYMPVRKRFLLTGGFSQVARGGVNVNGEHDDVWVSDDGGACWTELAPDTDAENEGRVGAQLAVFEDNGVEVLYSSGGVNSLGAVVFGASYSVDGGASWIQVGAQQQGAVWSPRAYHALVYDPITPRLVLCGGAGVRGNASQNVLRDVWTAPTNVAALVVTPAPTPLPTPDPTVSPTFPPNTPSPTKAGDECQCDTMSTPSNASACMYRFDLPYPHAGVCSRGESNYATPVPCDCIGCTGSGGEGNPDQISQCKKDRLLGRLFGELFYLLCTGVESADEVHLQQAPSWCYPVAGATTVFLALVVAACLCFQCVYLPLSALRRSFVLRVTFCSAAGLGRACLSQCCCFRRDTAIVHRAPDGRRFYWWEWRSERAVHDSYTNDPLSDERMQTFLSDDDVMFRRTLLEVCATDGVLTGSPPATDESLSDSSQHRRRAGDPAYWRLN